MKIRRRKETASSVIIGYVVLCAWILFLFCAIWGCGGDKAVQPHMPVPPEPPSVTPAPLPEVEELYAHSFKWTRHESIDTSGTPDIRNYYFRVTFQLRNTGERRLTNLFYNLSFCGPDPWGTDYCAQMNSNKSWISISPGINDEITMTSTTRYHREVVGSNMYVSQGAGYPAYGYHQASPTDRARKYHIGWIFDIRGSGDKNRRIKTFVEGNKIPLPYTFDQLKPE